MDPSGEPSVEPPTPPVEDDIALVQESLQLVADRSDQVMSLFFAELFAQEPALRALFPAAMGVQRERLFRAITRIVGQLADRDSVEPLVQALGREHRKYGVEARHYPPVGRALVLALRTYAEDYWVPELEAAWNRAYDYLAATMLAGAQESARREPAWWTAEVVAHERRAVDIAVITVRPDRDYPYRAGQFASIETPYRPQSWRTYSMANGPSPDGLVEFHVRAVGAGFVSGPLVWRAAVGDRWRMGAPTGEVAIDKQSRRDVLCAAGGTGLAPLKAMIDEMTRWNTARTVTLVLGVTTVEELYDLDALDQIASLNPWLGLVPCVTSEPLPDHRLADRVQVGTVPDVVGRLGRWTDHDVYVCGSPAMTRATLGAMRDLGIPGQRLFFDDIGDHDPATAQVIDLRQSRARRVQRRHGTRR